MAMEILNRYAHYNRS